MNIIDQHQRVHDYLRISLTERCNLRCFYCMPEEGIQLRPKEEFMKTKEVLEMAQIFVSLGVKKIRLTGGEPLVRNDAAEVISALSKLPVELAITSNGIRVHEFIDTFKSAGLKSINISLDTLNADKFKLISRRDDFEKVSSNIQLLLDEKFHVKVNAVVMKNVNDDEVCDFVEWTKNKNVHVRFIEFMPFNGNNWDWSKGVSYEALMQQIEAKYGTEIIKLEDKKNDTAKSYAIAGHLGTFAVISSVTNPFCDTCNRLRLTADGKLKNCLFSSSETDLLSAMRRGEDIVPLILENVYHKKAIRSGMETMEEFTGDKNRAMISIGG